MKNARPFAAAAATLLLISACNENDRPPLPEDGGRIRVEVGIEGTGATRRADEFVAVPNTAFTASRYFLPEVLSGIR